jgi:hypothetical protein
MSKIKTVYTLLILLLIVPFSRAQWVQVHSSPTYLIQDIVEFNGILYLAHFSGGVYKSTDSLISWQQISSGLNNNQAKSVNQILVFGDTIYAATTDGIYKSINGGADWLKKSNGITIGPGALYEFNKSIYVHNDTLFTGAFNGIYRSTDNAENWILTNISGHHVWAKNFVDHNGILFAAGNEGVPDGYKSTDGGVTWDSLLLNNLYPAITFFSEPPNLWAGTIHGVWLSPDNGITWEHRSNGLSPDPYSSSLIRVNGVLITSLKFGGSGIFRSTDEGMNWENFSDGLPFLNTIDKLIIYDDKILAATSDGLWQRDTSEIITGLEKKNHPFMNFELYQNYPNPFNPETLIRYSVPYSSRVEINVFNLTGQRIKSLVNGNKTAGTHQTKWDGKTDAGIPVASGVYIYRLKMNHEIQSRKMLLLR